jgi:EmrB/QacA subfamily drug resistance transporter
MQVPAQTGSQLAQQRPGGLPYKWIVAIVIIFGIFMSILDTTIVNVAIPRLQSAFGAGLTSVQWVATAYTLAQGVTTPLTPFFSQRIGIKRLYIVAITSFIIGSALCGLAWSLPVLILFRILQAVGGAFLFPLSITMLYSEFPPEERGTAIGTLGIPILIAPALGPTVGGFIVTYLGWQLIFYINVPIGIVGIILAMLLLREAPLEQQRRRFDIPGFVFSAIGLSALLYGLSDAGTDGWRSDIVLGCIALGVLCLAIFTVIELMIARSGGQPLLDLRVFGNGPFASSTIASVFVTFALYGGLFLVPIYLQDLRGLSAYQAGLILLPQALGSMVATLVGGRLVDRIGVKPVVFTGLAILAFALWRFSYLSLNTPYNSFQYLLILRGLGLGLSFQPLTVSALWTIQPRDLNQASSVSSVVRFVASSLGIAILSTTVQTRTQVHYSHLAERVTPASPLGMLIPRLEALFVASGASVTAAAQAATQLVIQLLQLQAFMLGIEDAFLLTLVFAIIAFIAIFFVRGGRQRGGRAAPQTPAPQEEERGGRVEATLPR